MLMDGPLLWQLLDSVCFLVLPRLFLLQAARLELFLLMYSVRKRSASTVIASSERWFSPRFDFVASGFEPACFASVSLLLPLCGAVSWRLSLPRLLSAALRLERERASIFAWEPA